MLLNFRVKIFSLDVDPTKIFQHENFSNENFPIYGMIHLYILLNIISYVQVMSGFHLMVQHTRTTVVWPWRTLMEGIVVPCAV